MLDPSGKKNLESTIKAGKTTVVLTDPEGGLTADEISAAVNARFISVALEPRIVCTETAPIVALGLVQYLAGNLRIS